MTSPFDMDWLKRQVRLIFCHPDGIVAFCALLALIVVIVLQIQDPPPNVK